MVGKNILWVLLCIAAIAGNAQDSFFITKVVGSIVGSNGKPLAAGGLISDKEILSFNDSVAHAHAIDNKSTVFFIMPLYQQPGFREVVNLVASPARKVRKASVDMFVPSGAISDLSTLFGNDRFAIFTDAVSLPINTSKVKLSSSEIVVISYKVGETTVSKKIPIVNGALVINRGKIFDKISSKSTSEIVQNCTLYLLNNDTKKYTEISSFKLTSLSERELTEELVYVKSYLRSKGVDDNLIKSYMQSYFYDVYGRTFAHDLFSIIDKVVGE